MARDRVLTIDLGQVKNIATVRLNGRNLGVCWKPPLRVDVGDVIRPGTNRLEVDVTNLWPNRLIGDEQEADDCDWAAERTFNFQGNRLVVGRPLARVPQWLIDGSPRPSKGRHTFTTFKFFGKDSPLLESGLFGPVKLRVSQCVQVR